MSDRSKNREKICIKYTKKREREREREREKERNRRMRGVEGKSSLPQRE